MRDKKINILSLYKTYRQYMKQKKIRRQRKEQNHWEQDVTVAQFDWHVISGKFSVERPQKTAQSYKDEDKLKKEAL